MDIIDRSKHLLNPSVFSSVRENQKLMSWSIDVDAPKEQKILRMLVKSPQTNGFKIPKELEWISESIHRAHKYQRLLFVDHPFVYITVRSGEVTSITDDLWHVDGFSMRVSHLPEQNYIWTDNTPTEILDQNFNIPEDFDPLKHNIHLYFQDRENKRKIRSLNAGHMTIIDPYVVHRRPQIPTGINRCFFRISFVPIEIEDDTCMKNPLLPSKKYSRDDIRKSLTRY